MNKTNRIKREYDNIEDLIPLKNIPDEIKIISDDIRKIDSIILNYKDDKGLLSLCEQVKKNLKNKLEYLQEY